MGSRNAAWSQLSAPSTSMGNPNAAAPHRSQSALSMSTGSLNATAAPLHQHAPSMLTGSPNAAPPPLLQPDTLQPATPPQLALVLSQHHRPTLQLRQLHRLACQPSRPLSSVLLVSLPPYCKRRISQPPMQIIYWLLWSAHSFGNLLQKCGYLVPAGCVYLEYPVNTS